MAQNIFEELQAKKQRLASLAHKAKEFGWIEADREKEIVDKLANDVLTIGVIGQMKCGKSTFLNSFVFEDDILPAATTPMTAALSVITYGEQKKVVAEFYDEEQWAQLKTQAARPLETVEGNTLEESKIKAAKELVEKAGKLGASLTSYLGKTQEDTFENLIDYVGADGKYISITKAVTIYYPKEYLKGVEIVDTPGFNDPIVSREERTKEFLKKADVVLMMLYAGRPFDATDRDILFQNVRQCGIGKVIIGINKYDIPYENGETETEIKDYVKEEIRKACKDCNDESLVALLREAEPIPLSAEMALLSEMPMTKVNSSENFTHAWNRASSTFEISSQPQMRDKSHIDDLISAVKKMVETEKEAILFAKPINAIMAAGNNKKALIEKDLREQESMVQNLSTPDDELEEKQGNLEKAAKRLNKKIDAFGDDLESEFNNILRKGKSELEDQVEAACKGIDRVADNLGIFEKPEKKAIPAIEAMLQELNRTLKKQVERLEDEAKSKIKSNLRDFTTEAQEILMRYVSDFDSDSFVKSLTKKIEFAIDDDSKFKRDAEKGKEGSGWGKAAVAGVGILFGGIGLGVLGVFSAGIRWFNHDENVRKLHDKANKIRSHFNPMPLLDSISKERTSVIELIKTSFISETIEPMQEQIEGIRSNKLNKEAELEKAKQKVAELKAKTEEVNKQLVEIDTF